MNLEEQIRKLWLDKDMTPEEMKAQMQQLVDGTHPSLRAYELYPGARHPNWHDDTEIGHIEADKLMVQALRDLGYGEAMDIYEAQTRYFV